MDERDYKAMNKDSQMKEPTEPELVENILAKIDELRELLYKRETHIHDFKIDALNKCKYLIVNQFKNQ